MPSLSIKEAAAKIRSGGLVAFPTETVYGLGVNALDAAAVQKIYEFKGRPTASPLIVHVASIEMAREIVADWPPLAEELARKWWAGPLTLVLPKKPAIPDIVTAGLPTVVCGPGSIDQAHKPDEFLEISQVEACIGFMHRLAAEMAN